MYTLIWFDPEDLQIKIEGFRSKRKRESRFLEIQKLAKSNSEIGISQEGKKEYDIKVESDLMKMIDKLV